MTLDDLRYNDDTTFSLKHLRATRTIFRAAKKFIKRGWVQSRSASDANDCAVDPDSPSACKWCASGAIQAAAWDKDIDTDLSSSILDKLVGKKYDYSYVEYNDSAYTTQAKVLRLFDKGIADTDRRIKALMGRKKAK